jgi:ribosomal protein L40E
MSHEITCRECNASNPPGSKFCSNCGEKLPPSTHMICPNCEAANPHDRIFCDNCGTRLVKDATVPLEGDKPEKPAGRGSAFSLPARRPGETGELDPSLLPEWLRTGETKSHQTPSKELETPEEPEDLPDWLQKSIDDTKDLVQPAKLEDLTSDKKGTDDLPDWLVDDSDSNPIIATPEEISTEMYLDLVNQDEGNISEDTPIDLTGANLPDWLSEASQISDTGKLTSDAFPEDEPEEDDAEGNAEEAQESETGVPEWLAAITDDGFNLDSSEGNQASDISGLTELLSMADEPEESKPEQTSDDEGFTDWLSDAFAEDTAAPAQQSDALAESSGGLTDWLSDPFSSEEEKLDEQAQISEDGLTDWLSDPFSNEKGEPVPQPEESEGLTDWLSPTDSNEQSKPDESSEVDDWLSELDNISESEIGTTGPLEDLTDAPDWLLEEVDSPTPDESSPPDTSAGIADEIAQTLVGDAEQVPTDFADLFQIESTDSEDLPDWLAGAASSGDSFIAEDEDDPADALDNLFEKEEYAAQSELDWLMQTGGLSLPDTAEDNLDIPEELQSESTPSDAFDWLSDLASLDTNTLQASDELDEPEETPELEEAPPVESEAANDWADTASFLASESQLQEEMPDWLPDLKSSEQQSEQIEDESEQAEDLPSWLENIEPSQASEQMDSVFSALSEEGEGSAEEIAAEQPEEDDLPEQLEELVSEDSDDDLLNELPETDQEEIVAGTIPDWLQNLKPDDSKSEDLSFMDEPAPVEEEDLPVETVGPLAGLRGVVRAEPVIGGTLTQKDMVPFGITSEQQQQVDLLRQMVLEKSRPTATKTSQEKSLAISNWMRFLLALLLLGAIIAGLIIPNTFTQVPDDFSAAESLDAINNAAGRPVLVAFEYSPGMAGELTPQANLILQKLSQNGSPILTISQFTTGYSIAETALSSIDDGINLGYLPGEAVGLRQLGDCLNNNPASCTEIPGWPNSGEVKSLVDDLQLIVILTGNRDSFVYWVEQVAQPTGIPLLAGVTQSLGPVVLPYEASGQLAGVIEGIPETAVFDQIANETPTNPQLQQQLNAQTFAQLLIVILLLIGMISYGFISPMRNREQ